MTGSASVYIGKDPNIECGYGEKCLKPNHGYSCEDIIGLLNEQLLHFFPDSPENLVAELKTRNHFDKGCHNTRTGDNYTIIQFYKEIKNGVRCDTNIVVNHPKAEEIRKAILKVVEPLREEGYKVE
jgi:hypothetical protein